MPEPTPDELKSGGRPAVARRRFTLLDGIILVAASAVGLKGFQAVVPIIEADSWSAAKVIADIRGRGFLAVPIHITYWVQAAMPWLMTTASALLVLRLLPPRPPRSILGRRRGFLATATVVGTIAANWLAYLLVLLPLERAGLISAHMPSWGQKPVLFLISLSAMATAGAAVAIAWVLASLLDRSQSGADWIDRAGVGLGVLMIASTPFYLWISLLYRQ